MFGWLQKKSENARVHMCVKELKWDLESASPLRRAKILAMAQFLRTGYREIPSFEDALENPLDYPREQMALIYTEMENVRNSARVQLSQLKKGFARMGVQPPEEMEDHVLLTNRAIEVWMTLFGCGLAPDVRDDVRKIWEYMSNSKNVLKEAILDLREMSARQAEFTGEDTFETAAPTDKEWLALCEFFPKQFKKNLF
jgi:hypothetical protein